jgi:hypothetical protein
VGLERRARVPPRQLQMRRRSIASRLWLKGKSVFDVYVMRTYAAAHAL